MLISSIRVRQDASPLTASAIDGLSLIYEAAPQNLYNNSIYAGGPSDATDDAWRELLGSVDIRATYAELSRNNRTSVKLPESGDYLAWLGVFHELHCVVSMSESASRLRLIK